MRKRKDKEEKLREKQEGAVRQQGEDMYIDKVLPVIDFDEDVDVGITIMEDGTFCDCFSIICKDLNSITNDQLAMDILTWEKVYKTYSGDLKIISFSFPTDTKEQQSYVEYKISRTENPILRDLLKVKQDELAIVHMDYMTREAALFFFAETATEYKKNFASLRTLLTNSMTPLVKPMPAEKKKKLFFKLCNKNLNH